MKNSWKPNLEEAQFLGEVLAIDASIAGHCRDLLGKGHSLISVRGTLEDALKIACMMRGKP